MKVALTKEEAVARFWGKVDTTSRNGCWHWRRSAFPNGYGKVRHNGKTSYAHRLSYEFSYGPISEGLVVRHVCDNPICVRPGHLLIGTTQDNVNDMIDRPKNRIYKRFSSSAQPVPASEMERFRVMLAAGIPARTTATLLGVSQKTLERWKRGEVRIAA